MKLIKSDRTGNYSVRFKTMSGKTRTVSLETKNQKEAKSMAKKYELTESLIKQKKANRDVLTLMLADDDLTIAECISEWKEHSMVRCKSANTLYTQVTVLEKFANFNNIRKLSEITPDHIFNYINEKCDVNLNSRNQRLAAIRSMLNFAVAKCYILSDPSAGVRVDASRLSHKQKETRQRVPFTKEDYKKMVAHAPYFFKQAVMLGWWTGLRAVDVCKLEWDSWGEDHLNVWTEKTDTRVALPYDNPLIGGGVLRKAITEIEQNDSRYCFPEWAEVISDPNKRSRFSVYFTRFLNRMEIEGKSFHSFRHSFVSRVNKEDYNSSLEKIAKWVGHSRTDTTKGYLHDVS